MVCCRLTRHLFGFSMSSAKHFQEQSGTVGGSLCRPECIARSKLPGITNILFAHSRKQAKSPQAPSAQAHVISPNDILADPAGIAAAFLQSSEELLLKRLVEAARFDATIIDTRWIDFYATPVDGDIRRQTADSEKAAEDLDLYLHLTKTYVKSCIPQEGTTIKELEANFGKEIAYGSMGRDKFMDILNDNARISQPSSRTASRSRKGTGPAAKTGKQG